MKGLITKIVGLTIAIAMTSTAHAVSFELTGARIDNTELSYVTINDDNTISFVVNGAEAEFGRLESDVLSFDNQTGLVQMFNNPDGVDYGSDFIDYGQATSDNGNIGRFASNLPVKLTLDANGNATKFQTWVRIVNPLTGSFETGRRDFHLDIGRELAAAEVPEPMTMSLLGMGLIGGAIRRKKATA